jgi:hypothetical protein
VTKRLLIAAILASALPGVLHAVVPLPVITAVIPNVSGGAATSGLTPSVPAGAKNLGFFIQGAFSGTEVVNWQPQGGSVTTLNPFFLTTQLYVLIPDSLLTSPGTATITLQNASGSSNGVTLTITNPPTITQLSPAVAAAGGTGLTLAISGQIFGDQDTVTWKPSSGTTVTGIATTFQSGTPNSTLTARLSSSLLQTQGTVTVIVVDPSGAQSTGTTFTIQPPPALTVLSPTSAPAGGGAFTLTITGTGFVSGDTVTWTPNGAAAVPLSNPLVGGQGSQITVQVPANLLASSGTALIAVQDPDGAASNSLTFSIAAPAITALNPPSVGTASSSFPLIINGTNFIPGTSGSGGYTGSIVIFTDTTGAQSILIPTASTSTQLTVNVTGSMIGNVAGKSATVAVQNPPNPGQNPAGAGGAVSAVASLPVGAPKITAITPTAATVGGASDLPVTITGSNFVANSSLVWCNNCNGSPTVLPAPTSVTSTQLVGAIPLSLLQAVGSAQVSVTNTPPPPTSNLADSNTNSAPVTFQISALGISSISPTTVLAGGPAFTLTINGSNQNFDGNASVLFGNGLTPISPAQSGGSISSSQITITVPATYIATPGSLSIQVQNSNGATSTTVVLPVQQLSITGVTPATLVAGSPSQSVVISGTSFSSSTQIQWTQGISTTTLQTTFVSSTQINAIIPQSLVVQAGTVQLVAVAPVAGGNVSSTALALPINGPAITSLTPSTSIVNGPSFALQVTGTSFLNGSIVQWTNGQGQVQSLVTSFGNSSQLTAIVPASLVAASGTALVTVVNPGGGSTGATSNGVIFAIGPTPTINTNPIGISVCPGGTNCTAGTSVTAGTTSVQLKIAGTNYQSGSIVVWTANGVATNLITAFVDDKNLTATLPSSLIGATGTALIAVQNPGNAVSNGVIFTVSPGATPVLSSISPATAVVGGGVFQLALTGSNFANNAVVLWNNGSTTQSLATIFQDSNDLSAVVPANLIATTGTVFISVSSAGSVSSALPFTISPVPAVTITSLDQTTATAGGGAFTLGINGTNFTSASVAQWSAGSGPQALGTIFVSSTKLSALIPAALTASTGTAFINVTNGSGQTSNTVSLGINPQTAPTISVNGLSPSSATTGSSAFQLTITGSNFTSGSQVDWNGGSGAQTLPAIFIDSSHLTLIVPASLVASAGTAFLAVENPGGITSGLVSFPITAAQGPSITGTPNPSSAVAGSASLQITINGANFASTATVYWNAGTGSPQALATIFVNANQLTALLPAALVANIGSALISVQNSTGGASSNQVLFSITAVPGPSISTTGGVLPASAATGSSGITLSITGTNFSTGSVVQWNTGGTPTALTTGYIGATQLTALVPASLLTSPTTALITVLNPDKSVSNAITFSVTGSAPSTTPTLSSISPTAAAAGSAALLLTVTGQNFTTASTGSSGSTVQWNGSALPTTFVSATQLTAQVDASLLQAIGSNFVSVLNGTLSSAGVKFQVNGPTLAAIAPTSAVAGGAAFSLTLTGTNFVSGSTAVWSGVNLATTVNSATQLTAQVPANLIATAGTAFVLVNNPGGSSTSPQIFTIGVPPASAVTGLNPPSAVAGSPAFQLTVIGSGFVNGSVVNWNGTALATGYVSATQITALVGASLIASAGTASVTVQNPGAPLSTSVAFSITGPSITTLTPVGASAGDPSFSLTVNGSNFVAGSSVQWNGSPLPTAFVSSTQLLATVPAANVAYQGVATITVANPGGATSAIQQFTIGPPAISVASTSLPDGVVGTFYSQVLLAQGGTQPYTWSITSGTLPDGLALDPNSGTISGTPTGAANASIGFTVTDKQARSAAKSLQLRIALGLNVTTVSPLTAAVAGSPYSVVLAATGGTPPYLWSALGALPSGLSLNVASGEISGTPTAPGSYRFSITVSDSRNQQTTSKSFICNVTVASLTINGVSSTLSPAQQIPITVTIGSPYSTDLSGTLSVTFTSAVGGDDPSIQFSTGGKSVNFTIPAGSTQAVFGQNQQVLLSTGTVAGTILVKSTLQANASDITPNPAPQATGTVSKVAPVITTLTLKQVTGGVSVAISGYSTTKEVTQASLQFNAAAGSSLTSSAITVPLSAAISSWYASSASAAYGSQFTVTIPLNVSGDISAVGSVTATLTNTQGTSAPVTANMQ